MLNEKNRKRIYDIVYIALFTALIAVCAWISVPLPTGISFTLQTFAIFATVGLIGGKRGTVAVLLYILLGLVGAPVFSNFGAGVAVLAGVTGGYIVGFLFSALVMWLFERLFGKKLPFIALSMILGLLVCYLFGSIWFVAVYTKNTGNIGFFAVIAKCVLPYVIPDLLKIALALLVTSKLGKYIKK